MTKKILKDTTLCAIIRDEMMNPAGGIERFIRSIVPHVERAVIMDTGSIDGTREKLERLEKEYSQMKVYDRKFDNYVKSRNASLEKVETGWTLVLDADELITFQGFKDLQPIFENEKNTADGFNFDMRVVLPDENGFTSDDLHNPRLFRRKNGFEYSSSGGSFSEYLYDYSSGMQKRISDCIALEEKVLIYHFMPTRLANHKKHAQWYNPAFEVNGFRTFRRSPSKRKGFSEWKAFNPKRDSYR